MAICSLRQMICILLLTTPQCEATINTETKLKMDEALLTVRNQMPYGLQVVYTSDYCYKCLYQHLVSMEIGPGNLSVVLSTPFTLTLKSLPMNSTNTLCSLSYLFEEAGHYSLWVTPKDTHNVTCYISLDNFPHSIYQPLWVAALVLLFLACLWASIPSLTRCSCTRSLKKLICCCRAKYFMERDEAVNQTGVDQNQPKSSRLKSLDTFRGFAITLMVFVNYGGGGYWFFQHVPWNGLTIADLVMPWFVFIIGTSVMLAFSSMRRKGVTRLQLLRKLSWRTVVLMLIGFCFINYSPRDGLLSWSWLRIPGVLQRLAFTYFVLSFMQMFCPYHEIPPPSQVRWWSSVQDVVLYWPEWIFILLLEMLWLCVTFLLPVPNCPTGYLGAGGIGDNGLYSNCTGGAAAYIDRWLLGNNIYWHPTCKVMYHTTQPFDPEGVLGTINSIVMGFIGMQAGKIFLFYRKLNKKIIIRFTIWAVILGFLAAILSKCTRDSGFIPVNKNLWSLSYVACMGSMSFVLLGMMYFVVDFKRWWGGQPFIYPGMNSILVYVGHSLLGFYFPFSWEMRSQDSHWEPLFRSLWGTALWIVIAYLLYRKRLFLKI